jgi:hypothetical protein
VHLVPDGRGGQRQAAFTTSKAKLLTWGFSENEISRGAFDASQALGLGPLRQSGLLILPGSVGDTSFGGVRIDGLISHAYLKRYSWTLDFERRRYIFTEPK